MLVLHTGTFFQISAGHKKDGNCWYWHLVLEKELVLSCRFTIRRRSQQWKEEERRQNEVPPFPWDITTIEIILVGWSCITELNAPWWCIGDVSEKNRDAVWELLLLRLCVTLPAFFKAHTTLTLTESLSCLGILKLLICYYQLFKKWFFFYFFFLACGLEAFVAFSVMIFLSKVAGRCIEIILNMDTLCLSALTVPTASAYSSLVLSVWMAGIVC